ncbi:MAG: hypothetical protein K8H99_08230 [Nitrospirae bacterium]|nr:hypothetical protein [Fimbriimonadaceae bacterium]
MRLRRLKVATTLLLVLAIGALAAWPWVFAAKPARDAPQREREAYGVWVVGYFGAMIVLFGAAAAGGLLVVRETRLEFRERSRANLDALIEGLREDHQKKGDQ